VRSGNSKKAMRSDTMMKFKEILGTVEQKPPRFMFIVHAYKDQIEDMVNEVKCQSEDYKTDGREVMCLLDTELTNGANDIIDKDRPQINDKKGWIFISHTGVSR
jgi:hypothetical protein